MENLTSKIARIFSTPWLILGEHRLSAANLVVAFAILIGGYLFSRAIQALLRRRLGAKLSLDQGAGYAASRFLHYLLVTLAGFAALQSVGINLSSLAVLGGFFGVGLGFGLQSLTANFVSGMILLIEQPVRVGDRITVGGHIGTVHSIGMRATEVQTLDEVTLILPNSTLVSELVINWTHGARSIRLHVPFGVAYGTDPERLRAVAIEACRGVAGTLPEPAPELRFLGFGESSLDFELLVWIEDPWIQFKVKSDVYFSLEKSLRVAGIEIPFPQRVVHLRGERMEQKS